jgi:N-formylglutamate deformylase
MNTTYNLDTKNSPLLISMPHVGSVIPKHIACNMTAEALQMPDVDWHLPQLYDMAKAFDASVISANYMRYVIDLNRSPDDLSLYPGQDTTGLCPIDTFAKQPIYKAGKEPTPSEIKLRIEQYWRPYHVQLKAQLDRIHSIYGMVILLDAHSIASEVPRFFDGKLPDLNFGTADSQSCDASLQLQLAHTMQQSTDAKKYSHVFNGRFKGGFITRHYGVPTLNIHALQLEISQCIYMQEQKPYLYTPLLAEQLKPLLGQLIETCISWAREHKKKHS